jgi:hypothetical protein
MIDLEDKEGEVRNSVPCVQFISSSQTPIVDRFAQSGPERTLAHCEGPR